MRHQEVLEKRGMLVLESWDCPSILPLATLPAALAPPVPGDLVLNTCKAKAIAGDSPCHGQIRAPFQRLQEKGSEP